MLISNHIDLFTDFIKSHGHDPEEPIIDDGILHAHVRDNQDRPGKKDFSYILHGDGVPAGWFCHYSKLPEGISWQVKADNSLTTEQREQINKRRTEDKIKRDQALQEVRAACRIKAEKMLAAGRDVSADLDYIVAHKIIPYGAKQLKDMLLIPLYKEKILTGLQIITKNSKKFLTGTEKAGAYLAIKGNGKIVYLCEGWADACKIHELTGATVIVCFDCGNLLEVGKAIKAASGSNYEMVYVADNDRLTENNPGVTKATAAALATVARLAIPTFPCDDGTDICDLSRISGNDAVMACLESAVYAQLHHNGDYAEAASALARLGYGTKQKKKKVSNSDDTDWKDKLDIHVSGMNENHCQVFIGTKHRIMRISDCKDTDKIQYFEQDQFRKMYQNTSIKIGLNSKDEDKFNDHATAWLKNFNCRTYTGGVIFKPNAKLPDNYLNLWQGFSVEPVENPKRWELLRTHIDEVICDNNVELIEYLYNWIAYTFQHPEKPAGSAPVLRGDKGVGKGIMGHFLKDIWGKHGFHISNTKHLVGNFNSHLADTCLLFADEAFYSGDKSHAGILKALITEPVLTIERKGIDVIQQDNYLKIFMVTNSDYAVPASRDERRYCVFDVSSKRKGDEDYFTRLGKHTENKDVQSAFLFDMLHRDISKFHTGNIPESVGLRDQRMHSLDSIGKWLVDSLTTGYFDADKNTITSWDEEPLASDLFNSYLFWCDNQKIGEYGRKSKTAFGIYLNNIGYTGRYINNQRTRIIGFLPDAIDKFELYEKVKI